MSVYTHTHVILTHSKSPTKVLNSPSPDLADLDPRRGC